MIQRTFTLDDQRAFAALSGDWNPLHVDPLAARRLLFGAPVVHGLHLVLWALDRMLAARPGGRAGVAELRARFPRPTRVGAAATLELGGDRARIRVDAETVLELDVRWTEDAGPPRALAGAPFAPAAPIDLGRAAIPDARGALALAVDPALAAALFPVAAARLAPLAELLAATRLVGMVCPGLHSLFGAIALAGAAGDEADQLHYEVRGARLAYGAVPIAVRGPTLAGTLDTFARPPPAAGPAMSEIRAAVTPGAYVDRVALVVGGSRGLGATLARALAAGGARVCLTYHRGAAEAAAVVADAGEQGRALALDVAAPAGLAAAWPFAAAPPTHLYYCATPSHAATLAELVACYVTGLLAVTRAARDIGPGPLVVWAPSTLSLETGGGPYAFAAAKAAMEELARRLPKLAGVRAHVTRLPALATDQGASVVPVARQSTLDVSLAALAAEPVPHR